jgi:hypothetical protein
MTDGRYECYVKDCPIRHNVTQSENFCFLSNCSDREINPCWEAESVKVFLGGTCGNSTWRDELIPILESYHIDYFNPVIKGRERTEQDKQLEIQYRRTCDYVLYIITPDIRGVYSIAEVIDDSNRRPDKTLFLYLPETEFNKYPLENMVHSLEEVGEMVQRNRAYWFKTWNALVAFFERHKPIRKEINT